MARHQIIVLFTGESFMADQFKRNIKTFNQGTQRLMVADDCRNSISSPP
jgi:hypothetical protein